MDNSKKDPNMLKPKISIFGIGGAGGNALNNMIQSNLEGVEFIAVNTDYQALSDSLAANRIQLGEELTKGLGAGSFPDIGRKAAEESSSEILQYIEGSSMVFVTAGMGGGTGTGASPVIAKLAKEKDILTVAVITKPFHFEGKGRMNVAEEGIEELKKYVDTIIVIPNQNLFRISNEQTTFESAFKMADDILHTGVRGITDLIVKPGLINLDFADIRTIMTKGGKAIMGTGEASGEDRAVIACEAAISNPLLDDVSIEGAKGVLVNMTGGTDITLFEADMAVNRIRQEVDENATIIFGTAFKEDMQGQIRISVVATGIEISDLEEDLSSPKIINMKEIQDDKDSDKELIVDIAKKKPTFFDPGIAKKPELDENNDSSSQNFSIEEKEEQLDDLGIENISEENIDSQEISELAKIEEEKEEKIQNPEKKEKSSFGLFSFMNSKKSKKSDSKKEEKQKKEDKIIRENLEKIQSDSEKEINHQSKENPLGVKDDYDNSTMDDEILSIPAFLRKK
jgi:cell division protein FtsZ